MADDLIQRLRYFNNDPKSTWSQAADEIERLLGELATLKARIDDAPVADVRPHTACARVDINGLPAEWGGKRVSLVLMEAGDG